MKSISAYIFFALIGIVGCQTKPAPPPPPPPPAINTIRIGNFQCANEITGQAVRNVFIEVLGQRSRARLVRDGDADVVVDGTITIGKGGASGGTKSDTLALDYVSGVTAVAQRGGEILLSVSWGQTIEKGERLLPPEMVARNAAIRLAGDLYRQGLQRR